MSSSTRLALKRKLQQRQRVFAGWTSIGHPSITEIFCRSGVDFIGIDLEHSTIDQAQSQRIIAACHAAGICCLPRIASHNVEMTRRLLDSGADGVIVPMVESAAQVAAIIDWVKYPVIGKRGFGVARAQGYGFDFSSYTKEWNESSIIIAQIESIQAVDTIESILDNPYLDGVMVGPYDISGSLKVPGQLEHPSVIEAGLRVVSAAKKFSKACGTQIIEPDQERIQKAFNQDYTFTILSSDVFLLWKWSERMQGLVSACRL